jgi:uncharacterized repeat protein (TIGR03806 family)
VRPPRIASPGSWRRIAARALTALPPLVVVAALLHACGGGGGGGTTPPPDPQDPFGLSERLAFGDDLTFPPSSAAPSTLTVDRAFDNLSFTRPVFLTHAPDATDRIFVVEQDGRVYVFPNRESVTTGERSVFLDLRASVGGPVNAAGFEEGLLGLAFDPEYATNRTFYVHYSAASPRRSVFARYRAQTGNPNAADLASAQVILEVGQPYDNHNGGWLGFGPDGYLYVALGDGGSGNDPGNNAQNMGSLLGKILRLHVRDQTTYAIPPDNPFVDQAGARPEIWCLGLRNPWRCGFDRQTGELWAGDVGQGSREEVDRIRRGGNYGWRVYEGAFSHINPTNIPPEAFDLPAIHYAREQGTTVIGGHPYRGPTLGSLTGAYVYGDYGSGRIWALVHDGTQALSNTQVASLSGLVSFGEDQAGELYAVAHGGTIHRFSQGGGGGGPTPPATLSATGLFENVATLTPHAALVPYDVVSPLWSDGALKRRWLALPDGRRIDFHPTEPWGLPTGTVLVKHFELELTPGNAATRTRVETRVLVRETTGWAGYCYRWNAAQTDANLLPDADEATYVIQDPQAPGGQRNLTWRFPSRSDCMRCHTPASGVILGVRTGQLQREFDYGAVTDNQLRTWNHIGLFDRDIGAHGAYTAWADPSDGALPVGPRARSYLAANCAQCHLPGGPAPGGIDLRYGTARLDMHVIDERPTEGDIGIPDAWRVLPFNRGSSVLLQRMLRLDGTRMPPLAHEAIDVEGTDLIGAWIDAGAP